MRASVVTASLTNVVMMQSCSEVAMRHHGRDQGPIWRRLSWSRCDRVISQLVWWMVWGYMCSSRLFTSFGVDRSSKQDHR